MFTHIIAVTNLEPNGDRALPVARALGSLADVDVEVLKVAPRSSSASVDTYELRRRAAEQGWPVANARVVEADDVAAAIAGEVNRRPDALLVMATSARIPLLGHLLGSVSEAVLGLVDRPVLLVGPHVPAEVHWTRPTLVVCVHQRIAAADVVTAVASWTHTFPTLPTRIVEVVSEAESGSGDAGEDHSHLQRIVDMLAAEGVEARWRLIHGGIPEIRLDEAADAMRQPLFVVASARWTGRDHGRSTTRRLVHRSTHPVLVVPVRSEAVPGGHPTRGSGRALHVGVS